MINHPTQSSNQIECLILSHSVSHSNIPLSTYLLSSCSISFPIYLSAYLSTCPIYLFHLHPSLPLTILTFFQKMIKTIKIIKHSWVGGGQQAILSVMSSFVRSRWKTIVSRIPSRCLSCCPQCSSFEESCCPPDYLLSVTLFIVLHLPYQRFVSNSSTYIYWSHW